MTHLIKLADGYHAVAALKEPGLAKELSNRLSIKSGQQGNMDEEDASRMSQIAQMITGDIDQTLQGFATAKASGGKINMSEDDPLVKGIYANVDPGSIRLVGSASIMILTHRWANMQNSFQRKAEMLALMGVEANALKYSSEHKLLEPYQVPPFMITLWGKSW